MSGILIVFFLSDRKSPRKTLAMPVSLGIISACVSQSKAKYLQHIDIDPR